ncbi:hypothetical protein DSO57_1029279 [Entomophthora muscae]|uniref:Uncharacterized protein n=1 Tax=Entomophthora muscae TaxID=34485 RepID=A0ACC2SQJ9_9FUNG|nr:hypothetical protein DSO57_1029279 [Entomophthora muscae]
MFLWANSIASDYVLLKGFFYLNFFNVSLCFPAFFPLEKFETTCCLLHAPFCGFGKTPAFVLRFFSFGNLFIPLLLVDKCSTGGAKFDRKFPPLSGEKKNQNLGKTDFYGSWNNLTSRQVPATLCQPPTSLLPAQRAPAAQPAACKPPASHMSASHPPARLLPATCEPTPSPSGPATCPQATHPFPDTQPTASRPPGSQDPLPSQPKPTMTPSQSTKPLETEGNSKNNSGAPKEGPTPIFKPNQYSKNNEDNPKITPGDKNNLTYSQWN